MGDGHELLERLRRIVGLGADEPEGRVDSSPPHDELPPGCEDVAEIPCEEAASRLYEYLDGELAVEHMEEIRCHVAQCERCYPVYEWERMFLDVLRDRGDAPASNEALRERVARLLDREED